MHYLNTADILSVDRNWWSLAEEIDKAVRVLKNGDYEQPLKPYLRYRDRTNRIIAMPAFVGGEFEVAGIKWIASFPNNLTAGLPRAHSVTILNNAATGKPECVINSPAISGIRTAAVSAAVISRYIRQRSWQPGFTVGMTGFGPIGRLHLEMVQYLLGDRLREFRIYDIKGVSETDPAILNDNVRICDTFNEVFEDADIFITATVSKAPYVDLKPKAGSLQMNISLRDFHASFLKYVDVMIVDDWDEVCRENTDIERMHLNGGLRQEQTKNLIDVCCNNAIEQAGDSDVIMFNPMGMAVFDIAIGAFYYNHALTSQTGTLLAD